MGLRFYKIAGRWRIEDDGYPVPAWLTAAVVVIGIGALWVVK